jgi:hypothetical protein
MEDPPVYYEEETTDDEKIDPSLLVDYVLLDLAPAISDAELEEVAAITLTNNSSSPPPPSLVEVRVGDRNKVSFVDSNLDVSSLPPPQQVPVTGWWEGWKSSSNIISEDYTPEAVNSPPPPQLMVDAWWKGWKSSTRPFQ